MEMPHIVTLTRWLLWSKDTLLAVLLVILEITTPGECLTMVATMMVPVVAAVMMEMMTM
jgi:hypothetical protein